MAKQQIENNKQLMGFKLLKILNVLSNWKVAHQKAMARFDSMDIRATGII